MWYLFYAEPGQMMSTAERQAVVLSTSLGAHMSETVREYLLRLMIQPNHSALWAQDAADSLSDLTCLSAGSLYNRATRHFSYNETASPVSKKYKIHSRTGRCQMRASACA